MKLFGISINLNKLSKNLSRKVKKSSYDPSPGRDWLLIVVALVILIVIIALMNLSFYNSRVEKQENQNINTREHSVNFRS